MHMPPKISCHSYSQSEGTGCGSGSGYTLAIFHHLILQDDGAKENTGKVVGIDHIQGLVDQACSNLKADD